MENGTDFQSAQLCRNMSRVEKTQLEFELPGIKSNKKNSCKYVSTKCKVKENVGLPLHRSDSLIMDNTVKVEVFHFLFAWERSAPKSLCQEATTELRAKQWYSRIELRSSCSSWRHEQFWWDAFELVHHLSYLKGH